MRANGKPRDRLYMTDDDLARLVLGEGKVRHWASIVPTLEREGLPRIDALMGGRFVPAVRAWLEQRHGLRPEQVPSAADGVEEWTK